MTNKNNVKKGINPLAAAAAGAVIGAGAVGLARVLKDKKSREKLKNSLDSIKKKGDELMKKVQDKTEEKTEEIEKNIIRTNEDLKKRAKKIEEKV